MEAKIQCYSKFQAHEVTVKSTGNKLNLNQFSGDLFTDILGKI